MQFFGGDLEDVESDADNSIRFNYNSFGKAAGKQGRCGPAECTRSGPESTMQTAVFGVFLLVLA